MRIGPPWTTGIEVAGKGVEQQRMSQDAKLNLNWKIEKLDGSGKKDDSLSGSKRVEWVWVLGALGGLVIYRNSCTFWIVSDERKDSHW